MIPVAGALADLFLLSVVSHGSVFVILSFPFLLIFGFVLDIIFELKKFEAYCDAISSRKVCFSQVPGGTRRLEQP